MESILTSPEVVKVLGFWGILIAIVLWVFKELIVNMPLGNMTSEHKYKLLKLLIYILGGPIVCTQNTRLGVRTHLKKGIHAIFAV